MFNPINALVNAIRKDPNKTTSWLFEEEAAPNIYRPVMPINERLDHARRSREQWEQDTETFNKFVAKK